MIWPNSHENNLTKTSDHENIYITDANALKSLYNLHYTFSSISFVSVVFRSRDNILKNIGFHSPDNSILVFRTQRTKL